MSNSSNLRQAFHRMLFCTDFSENADGAFPIALDIARQYDHCELHLLHVVPETEAQFWKSYIYELDDVDVKAKKTIDEHIETQYRSKVPSDQRMVVEFRVGNAAQEILTYAKENSIDLIIIGRQGRSGLGTALFGRVTERISRHAGCAVMIIPRSFLDSHAMR